MSNLIGKRVEVLDKGWIELVDMLPHPASGIPADLAIVNAARVSFLGESKGELADKKLLFYLLRNKHTSPFEQVVFKLRLYAPLVTYWQLLRHRMQSANLQSGRYTEFEEDCFYVPDVWRKQSSSNKQASEGELELEVGQELTADLLRHYDEGYRLYRKALDKDVSRELARLFLPGFSVYYAGVTTMNLHNLLHFLKLRMDSHAQHEIRVYADAIYREFVCPAVPWTAEAFEQYVLHGGSQNG